MNPELRAAMKAKWSTVKVGQEFTMKAFHHDMQRRRNAGEDVTLKSFLGEMWGDDYTPEKFYAEVGVDLKSMTVEKMLNTSELSRYLFPEVFRDAVRIGLEYTPFFRALTVGEERIESTGITMPFMDWRDTYAQEDIRLRDVNEGATIPEGQVITWREKQVTVKKKARGLKQTYESIMFTPMNLARVFFEELGTKLGADLDRDLINIAINGDQPANAESAPVMGVTTPGTLTYKDLARAWVRFRAIGRNSTVMLASENDVATILDMPQFQRSVPAGATTPSTVTLNVANPLPTTQDIYTHPSLVDGKIIFVDVERAFVQLTAMPLLIESEQLVSRQLRGEYVSLITGFANIFRDGRMVLDYTTSLVANPGPSVYYV